MSERFARIQPIDDAGLLTAIIETPKGSRQKYSYDEDSGLFRWSFELPEGMSFPYSFGFLPNTLAEDGDPVDVLILLDGAIPMSTLVEACPLGVIEAEQTEAGETVRNDRVIARARRSRAFDGIAQLDDLRPGFVDEIEAFFVQYNRLRGRTFAPLGRGGPDAARAIVQEGLANFARC